MTHVIVMAVLDVILTVILWKDIKYLCEFMGH